MSALIVKIFLYFNILLYIFKKWTKYILGTSNCKYCYLSSSNCSACKSDSSFKYLSISSVVNNSIECVSAC
jgi:hypothetical protein